MLESADTRQPRLVLASSSPRRKELISLLGLPVQILPSQADEATPEDWLPARVVEELARRKAEAVAPLVFGQADLAGNPIVVGSDPIVVLDGQIMGKPVDEADAYRMLRALAGRTHEVYTGICCMGMYPIAITKVAHRVTRVTMRDITGEQIGRYISTGEPFDKAGAYGIQQFGALLVDRIEGCYFNVVGLSVSHLAVMLEDFGISLP